MYSPDLQVQMQWRRSVLRRIESDFLELPLSNMSPLWERPVSGSRRVLPINGS